MEDKEIVLRIYKDYKRFILHGLHIHRPFYDMEDLWQDVLADGLEAYETVYDPSYGVQPCTYLITRAKWFALRKVHEVTKSPHATSFEDFVCWHRDTPLETQEILDKIMVMLPLRHRKVVRLIYLGYTYEEIGKTVGVSKQRIYTIFEDVRRIAEKLCFE